MESEVLGNLSESGDGERTSPGFDERLTQAADGAVSGAATPKVAELLAGELRRQIIAEGLDPGSALPSEAMLIDRYRFSRASVREALRLLESEGLVYIKRGPGGGIRVRHPDASQVGRSFALLFATAGTPLIDLERYRQILEPLAAADAAEHATPEQHEQLMETTEAPVPGPRHPSQLNFHSAISQCVRNELLRVTLTAVQHLSEWHMPSEGLQNADIAGTRKAHRRIALAIVRGDAEGARTSMLTHLRAFEDVLRQRGRLDEPIIPRGRWGDPLPDHSSTLD